MDSSFCGKKAPEALRAFLFYLGYVVRMSNQNPAPPATVQAFQKANQDLLHAAKQLSATQDSAAIVKGLQELEATHTQAQTALKAKN